MDLINNLPTIITIAIPTIILLYIKYLLWKTKQHRKQLNEDMKKEGIDYIID